MWSWMSDLPTSSSLIMISSWFKLIKWLKSIGDTSSSANITDSSRSPPMESCCIRSITEVLPGGPAASVTIGFWADNELPESCKIEFNINCCVMELLYTVQTLPSGINTRLTCISWAVATFLVNVMMISFSDSLNVVRCESRKPMLTAARERKNDTNSIGTIILKQTEFCCHLHV